MVCDTAANGCEGEAVGKPSALSARGCRLLQIAPFCPVGMEEAEMRAHQVAEADVEAAVRTHSEELVPSASAGFNTASLMVR